MKYLFPCWIKRLIFEQRLVLAARPPNVKVIAFIIADLPPRKWKFQFEFCHRLDSSLTSVVSDDHIQIFIEIEFEKCVTHKILHADSKNWTSIFMKLRRTNRFLFFCVSKWSNLLQDSFSMLVTWNFDFESLEYFHWVHHNLGHRHWVQDFFVFYVARRRMYLMRMNRA